MSQCNKKGPISARYLTKKQVSTISAILADVMEQSKIDIGKTIDTKLSEDITITRCDTKVWIKTIFMENMDDLLKQCTETFCNMYHDCNVGTYKDKYALLQIRWGEWISKSLGCGTKENHAMIPDPVSSRTNTTGNGFESAHVSCVIHALCMTFFQSASDIVKSVKPNNRQNPATPVLQNDSLDQVLIFSGACMYLIWKKSCKDTKRLVHNLIMTNDMKQFYRKYGVLSPGTESLPTIPVRALNQYIVFLNRCIQESCTENALQLYGHDFVKVIVHSKHFKSYLQRWPFIHWIFPCINWHHRRPIVCVY